jgi:uncharacterized protein (DUF111 family)
MKGLTLEELEKRVKVVNEVLKAVNISIDFSKVYATLESLEDFWAQANTRFLLHTLQDEIKEMIIRAVFNEHYIDPTSVSYSEVGFIDRLYDECTHHAFIRLDNGRYALIYSCSDDKIEYALPEH